MSLALCLRFDRQTSEAIERIWHALAEASVSSDMLQLGYAPHLTLVVAEEASAIDFAPTMAQIAEHVPASILLGEARSFPGSQVVYLSSDADLSDLQRLATAPLPPSSLHEHYRSGAWTPHVTLQTHGETDRALSVVQENWRPLAAIPVALDLITFPPVGVRSTVDLGRL
jgi:2'-5' RNA ligase